MLLFPHAAQVPRAVVMSSPNAACSAPASALPSSASIGLSSCGPEAFGPDCRGIVAELDEAARSRLDETRRAADVNERLIVGRERDIRQQRLVDPACVSGP